MPEESKTVYEVWRKNGSQLEYIGFLYGEGFTPGEGGSTAYTEEPVKVGKWVDGSPIYRKVFKLTNFTYTPAYDKQNVYMTSQVLSDVKVVVSALLTGTLTDNTLFNIPVMVYMTNGAISIAVDTDLSIMDNTCYLIMEYVQNTVTP